MATKHATSKLRTFGDLYGETNVDGNGSNEGESTSTPVSTLGFRGEALFSLANISKSLVVSTRTKEETAGEEISFDSQGNVLDDTRRPVARSVGTTVTVHGLFERLPVRRVDLCKRIKSQRTKLIRIFQGCKFRDM
jgi:DNA mismatch repair protein PMS2